MTREESLLTMVEGALEARGMGAPVQPQAAAAHAANESAFGRSVLAVQGKNLFGVKATGQHTRFWNGDRVNMPTWEVVNGARVNVVEPFRRYTSWAQSFGDYGDIISRVYPSAAAAQERDVAFLAGLFITGPRRWATDPLAFDKACRILAQYHEVLYPAGIARVAEPEVVVLHGVTPRVALRVAEAALLGAQAVIRQQAIVSVTDGRKVDVRWEAAHDE